MARANDFSFSIIMAKPRRPKDTACVSASSLSSFPPPTAPALLHFTARTLVTARTLRELRHRLRAKTQRLAGHLLRRFRRETVQRSISLLVHAGKRGDTYVYASPRVPNETMRKRRRQCRIPPSPPPAALAASTGGRTGI